jgi:hypothetical protein
MTADRSPGASAVPSSGIDEGPVPRFPHDPAHLVRVIRDFNLARTNAALYPPDHPLIAGSLDRAFAVLNEAGASGSPLVLVVSKDGMIAGGRRLEAKIGPVREFASALSERNILSITFVPGFTREDLLRLHRVLNLPAAEFWSQGGARESARRLGLERIVIRDVDYSRFRATEAKASPDSSPEETRERGERLWERFVDRVLAEDAAASEPAVRSGGSGAVDPERLARFINDDPESALAALRNFGDLVSEADGHAPEAPMLGKIGDLLRRLKPELKNRLLAMTFEELKDREDVAWDGLGNDLVLEMLEQVGRGSHHVPPALSNMVNALFGLDGRPDGAAAAPGFVPPGPGENQEILEKFQTFFAQESQTSYVDLEYGEVLDRLSRNVDEAAAGEPEPEKGLPEPLLQHDWRESLAADLKASLDQGLAQNRIFDILTALLDGDLDPEDFAPFARGLAGRTDAMLAAGEYGRLAEALRVLERRAAVLDAAAAEAARDALEAFRAPGFIPRAVKAFLAGAGSSGGASAFFRALGAPAARALVDLYVGGGLPAGWGRLSQLLAELGGAAADEMRNRLTAEKTGVVRQALSFFRKYGAPSDLSALRPLLGHPDDRVRMDALAALLALDGDGASGDLLRAFRSPVEREALAAIRLAGQHRRAEAVPALLAMVTSGAFRKPDGPRNLEIVRALGRIGAPAALGGLERIVRRRDPFHPRERRNLKLAIYESLDGYPLDSLARILSAGLREKDPRIRAICMSTRRRGEGAAGRRGAGT